MANEEETSEMVHINFAVNDNRKPFSASPYEFFSHTKDFTRNIVNIRVDHNAHNQNILPPKIM